MAAVIDGLQTYEAFSDNPALDMVDLVLLSIFTLEILLKILSHKTQPYRFFIGLEWKRRLWWDWKRGIVGDDDKAILEDKKLSESDSRTEEDRFWNCFDVFVVAICYMGMFSNGGNFGFLRMLRLLRIIRLLRVWKQLQQILLGLVGGLQASASILGLMAFFFFLYGTMGVYLFSENDPFHFKSLPLSAVSLYSVTNLEWIDIAAINIYGCDSESVELYAKFLPSRKENRALYDNVTRTYLLDAYLAVNAYYHHHPHTVSHGAEGSGSVAKGTYIEMERGEWYCIPNQQTVLSVLYFVSFAIGMYID
jgi:hypothetical protein